MQAARQYFAKFKDVVKSIGFVQSKMDPCLFLRKSKEGIVYMGVWVDDCLLVGDQKSIDKAVKDMEQHFKL